MFCLDNVKVFPSKLVDADGPFHLSNKHATRYAWMVNLGTPAQLPSNRTLWYTFNLGYKYWGGICLTYHCNTTEQYHGVSLFVVVAVGRKEQSNNAEA